ncbi:MAG: hypothetical protein H0S85_10890 [Desulfovibrionaceae bacterium]|jgi:hypothetical protein|nr:hypothetical protein [Desulfovibrionaceae bacterium]
MNRLLHLALALAALLLLSVAPAAAGSASPPHIQYEFRNNSKIPASLHGMSGSYIVPICTTYAKSTCGENLTDKYSRFVVQTQNSEYKMETLCTLDVSNGKNKRVYVILFSDMHCTITTE